MEGGISVFDISIYAIVWIAVIIVALIIEGATASLTTIWFAIGAVVAWIVSFIPLSPEAMWPVQILVFLVVSLILLYFTRPLAMKYLKVGRTRTNADSNIGKIGLVIQPIDPIKNQGQVKVGGQVWSAKTDDNRQIAKGANVTIKAIQGVKLIVEEKVENNE